jgi:hypothetical protein
VSTERDKFDETSKGKFTDIVSVNVDVSGVFATVTDWIDGHRHCLQIIFKVAGRSCLGESEILKDITDVHDLFADLAGSHVFSIRT